MDRYWTKSYPTNVPAEVDVDQYGPSTLMRSGRVNIPIPNPQDMDATIKTIGKYWLNVYANEIEAVAINLEGVDEAAYVGVSDKNSGEVAMLFVTKTNADLTEKQVRDLCGKELTGYKNPKSVRFVDEMSKKNVGEILGCELHDAAVKQLTA